MLLELSACGQLLSARPEILLASVLTLGVLFVNGWTDAPNAITAVVASGALSFRRAALLSALCNLLGGLWAVSACSGVTLTIATLAEFGGDGGSALRAVCAAMASLIIWSVAAWFLGLPTSESHGLAAALTGAALASGGGMQALNWASLARILLGLAGCVLFGFILARVCWHGGAARMGKGSCARLQLPLAAGLSFFHGAQDGQKFIGVLLLCLTLSPGGGTGLADTVPLSVALPALAAMGAGTCVGGRRIIQTLGAEMVRVDTRQGFAAELACVLCLGGATLLGLPVSTTHTKAAALWGAGTANGGHADRGVLLRLWLVWLATFPCCGLLSFWLTRLLAG